MKKYFLPAARMTLVMLVLCCGVYFALVYLIGKATPGGGGGEKLLVDGKVVGYSRIGQKFTEDRYFWGRPSAVDYNAAGSAGSNKGPTNPDYLSLIQQRLDSFLAHHPGVAKEEVPAELVTASGSGLDPHLTPPAALVQVSRVARSRGEDEGKIKKLVQQQIERHGVGPDVINVLKLNIALDALQ